MQHHTEHNHFPRTPLKILAIVAMAIMLGGREVNAENPGSSSLETSDNDTRQSEASNAVRAVEAHAFAGEKPGDVREDNELNLKLVWCPPGTFIMGSQPGEDEYRTNEHRVQVTLSRGFWIGKYEVVQEEWDQLMESNPSEFSPTGQAKYKIFGKSTSRFPVESLLVEEAEAFCNRLTERERSAGRLPTNCCYTLPTEAQWEYACRAGTTTATAFGDQLSSADANFKGFVPYNGAKRGPFLFRTTNVGSYRGNAWGIHDMHGNVWEYCAGWYTDVAPGGTDPEATTSGTYRIGKGGSWFHDGRYSRSAFRYWIEPDMRQGTVGFRVALTEIE
ncbi:MAG: formylglycine-generating enzyme family protein [Planctomycetaceae bacterium]|nr:formylglycine-generating enzyme family protein [Planctomycetales bacterium]MCB9875380.1 formylglycine-generating enzyme family protein [Planctomycetaceae bacterium]MCB9937300.1 formylglycine-generating enzyme family protein [Planctomycetaceae bacterium]